MQQRSLSALFLILTTIACNLPAGVSPPPATATVTRTFFPLDQTATQAALSTLLFLTGTATPPPVTLTPQPSSAFPTLTPNALTTTAQAALVTPSITVTSFFLTIQRFEADRELIAPGESFTVFWETSGDQVSLCSVLQSGESGLCEEVPSSGSRLVSTTATDRNTSAITLISVAGEITETVILSVRLTCPVSWFFSPSPAGENGEALCPREGSQPSGGAYQRFERGLMIWRQATDTIFVLFSDGGSPAYLIVPDPWVDGQAESDPGLVPPEGRVQPVRGFGAVWRDGAAGIPVRERLGWGTAAEFGFTTNYQCEPAPRSLTCYLPGPDGTIQLQPDGAAWKLWP